MDPTHTSTHTTTAAGEQITMWGSLGVGLTGSGHG